MSIDIGNTESKLVEYLLYLYKDSSLLSSKDMPFEYGFLNESPEDNRAQKERAKKIMDSLDYEKSLIFKIN